MKVTVKNNNVERALKIFKRKSADIVWDYRTKEFYEKPSVNKHLSHKAAIKREKKRQGANSNVKWY